MTKRPEKGQGLFYHRDSGANSTLVPPQYVEWAARTAAGMGVAFSGTPAAISAMIADGRFADGALFLDYGVSGNILRRPGLDACIDRALQDPSVTHLYFPRRDRIARPDDPADGLAIERTLRTAGLTLVFMDGLVLGPTLPGADVNLGEQLVGIIEYHKSGDFRRELAEKLIHAKIELAESGFSIGGEPPYGFRRWLCTLDGTPVRQLEPLENVKWPGHHVIWRPTAVAEIAVVLRVLDEIETTPASRIARQLSAEGIPSPKAGQQRTVDGVTREVSGQWTQNTVRNIVSHSLLIAVWEYGKRSEGDRRRLTKDGPRPLGADDFQPDGKTRKTVRNPADRLIVTPAKSEAVTTPDKLARIRAVIEERGRHLKGRAKTPGQAVNPLGGRVFDLNCGWPLYRYAKRKKWCYACGLYQNSEAKRCRHNMVSGETATMFVLACVRQRVLSPAVQAKLKARLTELAAADQGEDPGQRQVAADKAELAAVRKKVPTVERNLAFAETQDAHAAVARVLKELKAKEMELEGRIAAYRPAVIETGPEQQVAGALIVLDRLTKSVATDDAAWAAAGDLFNQTDARLYLRFTEVERGRRKFNVPAGGVLTFGSVPPPGLLYTGPTDRAILRKRMAAGEPVTAVPECVAPGDSDAGQGIIGSANVQRGTARCI